MNARVGVARRVARCIIVSQKMRQLMMHRTARRWTIRSAVRSFDAFARHPDLRTLWNKIHYTRVSNLPLRKDSDMVDWDLIRKKNLVR